MLESGGSTEPELLSRRISWSKTGWNGMGRERERESKADAMRARGGGTCGGGYGSNGEDGKLQIDAGRRKRSLAF
jgi:hypothetical protein